MKSNENVQFFVYKTIIAVVIYGILSALLLVSFNWAFSLLVSKEILHEGFIEFASIVSVFLASSISGFISSKAIGRALLTSAFQGLVNFFVCYIMGMIIFMRIVPRNADAYQFIACMVGALLGGVLSAALSPHRRKIKK